MRTAMLGSLVVVLASIGSTAFAQNAPHTAADAPHGTTEITRYDPRPVPPESSPLAGSMLILIAGMFLAAATLGPVVRYHAQEDVPDDSPHDPHEHGTHDPHGRAAHGMHGH